VRELVQLCFQQYMLIREHDFGLIMAAKAVLFSFQNSALLQHGKRDKVQAGVLIAAWLG